jgi:hypothetical protein
LFQQILALNPFTKNTVIAFLVTANVLAIAFVMVSRYQMKKTLSMYEHPAVIQKTQIKRVAGPVRIVERIVEKPGGERVIERTIEKAAVTTTKDAEKTSIPVAPAGSQERYLLGGSWQATIEHPKNLTAWAGYSFGRLDLLGGVGLKEGDNISGHLMVVTRWGN